VCRIPNFTPPSGGWGTIYRVTPRRALLLLAPALTTAVACGPRAPAGPTVRLEALEEDGKVAGFTARSVYLDATSKPIGARFVHDGTGFTFDYLRIDSAPQGFLWVGSFPTSDMGEPHTQEHLLLGKGDHGRRLGGIETMALGESSAFTEQWRTCYHFHTVAGPEAYWTVFDGQLDALLNPDYTDEEIRREVAHYGVAPAADGTLHMEEKGTVYNEMVRTFEDPISLAWRRALQLVYGERHALSYESGGEPAAIRRMTPKDIRDFHQRNYHLANMGMIGAFPSSMTLGQVLARTGALLDARAGRKGPVVGMADLPKPAPAPAGTIALTEYPHQDAKAPGSLLFAWPASRDLDAGGLRLLSLFLDSVAGDESTTLYKAFLDSKTRRLDLGATGVWGYVSHDLGQPVLVGLQEVAGGYLDEAGARKVRAEIAAELARIASLHAGAPELLALNERVRSRLVQERRALAKNLNTPPGFGFRGTGSDWMRLLLDLEHEPGFERSLVLAPELAGIETVLSEAGNPWSSRVASWGLLTEPYVVISRPSPRERERLDRERAERIAAETARVTREYGAASLADGLRRFAQDYDAATKKLEESARSAPMPELVSALPMTLDDGLGFREDRVRGVSAVTSTFPGTTSGAVGIAFDLGGVPERLQPYLHLLPTLLTESGSIVDGRPLSAEEVFERQRREVLSIDASIQSDVRTGRVELRVAGQGIDAAETKRAIAWMIRVLTAPDWRIENLPRLRDLADREAQELRTVMRGPEEGWVTGPRDAYQHQSSPVWLHAVSLLTAAHDAHRVRWRLLDPGSADAREAEAASIAKMAGGGSANRAKLLATAGGLAKAGIGSLREAGKDLTALVPDLPDGSLAADWSYLCGQMSSDLRHGAPATLADLEELRSAVVRAAGARLWIVGSEETQRDIASDLDALVAALGAGPAMPHAAPGPRSVDQRLNEREPAATRPEFVGIVNPATQSGVFLNAAPAPGYADTGDGALLDYLAASLYSGHGAHGIFMKTWAAGLAYSNGFRPDPEGARLLYYAERCPDLPQTLRFVIDEMHKAKPDESIVRYALASAFDSRLAETYEDRGKAMADDLADGVTPGGVRAFRTALLAAGKRPLVEDLTGRFPGVYARVLPGYAPGWAPAEGAVYMVLGPDRQLDAWQQYLVSSIGPDAKLWKLYPRDFWIPAKQMEGS
jgi:Zn-dependent M16 (insulinase) family peptidase